MIIARSLGAEGKGIYTLILTVGSVLSLVFNFGISGSLTYLVASKQFTPRELASFVWKIGATLGIGGGISFYWLYSSGLLNKMLAGTQPLFIIFPILSLPVILLISFYSTILLGTHRITAFNSVEVTRYYSNLCLQIISSTLHWGITGALIAWSISNLITLAVVMWLSREYLNFSLSHPRSVHRAIYSFGMKNYIATLTTFFNYRLDTFFVNYYSGPISLGQYSIGFSLAELIWFLPNSVGNVLFPRISSVTKETANRITAEVCRLIFLASGVAAILLGVAGTYLIPWVYGEQFRPAITPFQWLLPGIVGMSISKIISADLSGRGKPHYPTYTSLIVLSITICLDILLIPTFSIVGAAIASTIAYLGSGLMSIFWFSREAQTSWRELILPRKEDFLHLKQIGLSMTSGQFYNLYNQD